LGQCSFFEVKPLVLLNIYPQFPFLKSKEREQKTLDPRSVFG
jgi:hypothetical protein